MRVFVKVLFLLGIVSALLFVAGGALDMAGFEFGYSLLAAGAVAGLVCFPVAVMLKGRLDRAEFEAWSVNLDAKVAGSPAFWDAARERARSGEFAFAAREV